MLSRLVITFLPRSKCLLISWLQSPSAVILEPRLLSHLVSWFFYFFLCFHGEPKLPYPPFCWHHSCNHFFLKKNLLSLFIWPCHLSCSMWHLPCGMWDLSIVACKLLLEACEILVPWPRIKPGPPALGTPSLSYCTIGEVLPPAIIS